MLTSDAVMLANFLFDRAVHAFYASLRNLRNIGAPGFEPGTSTRVNAFGALGRTARTSDINLLSVSERCVLL